MIKVEKLSSHKSNRTNFLTLNYEILENLTPHKQHFNPDKKGDSSLLNNDKMSESTRQNVGMVIQKNTYKDLNNKSDSDKIIHNLFKKKQAEQVIHKKIESNGVGDFKKTFNCSSNFSNTLPQKPIKNTTVQDMLAFWNKTFPMSKMTMNKDLAPLLLSAFKQKCDGNMKKWENYLHRLQSSDYIASEAFNLSLNWALKFNTMDRIFKGELGAKDIPVQLDIKAEESRALDHIQNCSQLEADACCQIRLLILQKIGAFAYNAWFTKVIFVEISGTIKMKADNKFVEDYILQHYGCLFLM